MGKLAAGHDIARIGKSRDPASVFEPGIPADMVPMQVSAHHVVDILHTDAGAGEIGDIGAAQPMELWPRRTLLVVAEAGIYQDRMVPGLDDEAVKAEEEVAACWVDQPRTGMIRVRPQDFPVEIGEKRLGGNKGSLIFRDAVNLEIPDTRDLHLPLRTCRRQAFASAPYSVGGRSTRAFPRLSVLA